MHKSGFAEWLLRCAADDERGIAIYGDLLEMAAARGRAWFWLAYAQTLLALTWRTAAAFVAGTVVFVALYRLRLMLPRGWLRVWLSSGIWIHHAYFYRSVTNVARLLWFLFPFAATRYGMRDRFVRLTFAASAAVTVAYFSPVFPLLLAAIGIALLMVIVSTFSMEWRGAGVTLAGTTAISVFVELTLLYLTHIGSWYYNKHRFGPHFELFDTGFALERHLFWKVMWAMFAANAVVLASVSKRLRGRFMRNGRATVV